MQISFQSRTWRANQPTRNALHWRSCVRNERNTRTFSDVFEDSDQLRRAYKRRQGVEFIHDTVGGATCRPMANGSVGVPMDFFPPFQLSTAL